MCVFARRRRNSKIGCVVPHCHQSQSIPVCSYRQEAAGQSIKPVSRTMPEGTE